MKNSLTILFIFFSNFTFSQLIGRVINVVDGDSFTLLDSNKNQIKIRLYGIDCPEYSQDYGKKAKQNTIKLIFKEKVVIIDKGKDKY